MKLIPETGYTDYYDIARFELTWKINLFLTAILPLLCLSFVIFNQDALWPSLVGLGITSSLLIYMKKTRTYRIPSMIFTILGFFLCQYAMLLLPKEYHLVDIWWIMMIIVYTYFALGNLWGNLILFLNLAGIAVYILLILNKNLTLVGQLSEGELVALTINFTICGIVISYLLKQFVVATKLAEKKYKELTEELQSKNIKVEQQNQEKTVMLKEIHHRVKNNLQVITSLLRLQSRELRDPETIELFRDSMNRVVAMAHIHDKMYQAKDLSQINLEAYLKTLIDDMILSYSIEIPIRSDIKSEIIKINNESLVPLALIFNELVANSLKHAFKSVDEGEIRISITKKNNFTCIEYHDNGEWIGKQKHYSFGLELIESLTEQMSGTFERTIENGTQYIFHLPDNL